MITNLKKSILPRVGVGVLIFNPKGQLLLGKRKNSHGEGTWAPPGGHLEYGESLEECAIREAKEETGLNLSSLAFYGLTNDVFAADNKHYISIFMVAYSKTGQDAENMEPDKVEEWRWFDLDSLPSPLFPTLENLLLGQSYGTEEGLKKFLA